MATSFFPIFTIFSIFISLGVIVESITPPVCNPDQTSSATLNDIDLIQFAENLEFLEAEYFLHAALGRGLDVIAPELVKGGPRPIGGTKANLDRLTRNIITEFGYQEVGHLRAIQRTVGAIPRPLLDLSAANFAKVMDSAFKAPLRPPFNPYANGINYMLSAYLIPYMGLVGYVGSNPYLKEEKTKRLSAGLLGVEAGQDAVIRMYLYERAGELVYPYRHTVGEFTARISELRNQLGMCGIKDEGVYVLPGLGAENRTSSNVLSADGDSISYSRTAQEILRVVYSTGDEHAPGGFYPRGGNGKIARELLGMSRGDFTLWYYSCMTIKSISIYNRNEDSLFLEHCYRTH